MADYPFYDKQPGPERREKLNELYATWEAAIGNVIKGDKGWSPLIRAVADGERVVLQLYDWAGGQGTKPTQTGYLGATGYVSDISSAIDFRGPIGAQGAIGPANTLSIGTVSSGANASATITGTSPSQVLSLVLPKGDTGDVGAAATISVGTVTTGAAGTAVQVTNVGSSSAAVFDFTIPKGEDGSGVVTGTDGYITVTSDGGGNPVINVGDNVAKTDTDSAWTSTGSIKLPTGSTGDRGVGAPGRIRFNTEIGVYEGYDNTGWFPLGSSGAMDVQTFQGDGVTTTFTLSSTPRAENNTQVFFNGIYQQKNSYELVGNSLVFDEAPAADISIEVVTITSVAIGVTTAAQTSIVDSGNYYSGSNVESALQQSGFTLSKAVLSYNTYVEAEASAATLPDGRSVFSEDKRNAYSVVAGGLVFVRNYSRPVNALDYVFKTNAADKTAAINEALVAAQGKAIYFPAHPEGGVYAAQAGGLVIPSGVHIIGDCGASVIKSTGLFDAGAGAGMRLFDARNANDWSIRDVLLDLSEITNFPVAIRAMRVQDCTRYKVTNVHFKTPGAAIASMGCHGYEVLDNVVDVISTDGVPHHDGVIDQWAGSTVFKIKGNWIYGNGIPLYPILVTGTDSNNVATPSYDFEIKDNKVYDTNEVAIWVQGRSGRVYDFQVTGNLVDGVTDYHGLAISEADDFVAAENTIKRVARNGIRVFNENTSYGTLACRNGTVADNIVSDTNRAGLTGTNSEGAAIAVTGNSSGITLSANRVKAGGHTYAAFLGDNTTGIEVIGESMTAGSAGLIYNNAPANIVPGGGKYTPTVSATANVAASTPRQLSYTRSGDLVTVSGRIEVTPTATSTTTKLNLSLPIPSNFSDTNIDCSGSANSAFGLSAAIFADTALDAASLQFQSTNTSSNSLFLRFTYRIKP